MTASLNKRIVYRGPLAFLGEVRFLGDGETVVFGVFVGFGGMAIVLNYFPHC